MTEPKTKTLPELFADACNALAEGIRSASPSFAPHIPKLTQDETAAMIIKIVSGACPTAPVDRGPIAAVEHLASGLAKIQADLSQITGVLCEIDIPLTGETDHARLLCAVEVLAYVHRATRDSFGVMDSYMIGHEPKPDDHDRLAFDVAMAFEGRANAWAIVACRDQEIATLSEQVRALRGRLDAGVEAANAVVGKLAADQADEIARLREQLADKIGTRDRAERVDHLAEIRRLVEVDRIKSECVCRLERDLAALEDQINHVVRQTIPQSVVGKLDEIECHTGGEAATNTERVLHTLQHVLDVEHALDEGSGTLAELRDDSLGYAVALEIASTEEMLREAHVRRDQALANLTYVTRAYVTATGALAQLGAQTSGLASLLTRELKLPHPRAVEPIVAPSATPSEETES